MGLEVTIDADTGKRLTDSQDSQMGGSRRWRFSASLDNS